MFSFKSLAIILMYFLLLKFDYNLDCIFSFVKVFNYVTVLKLLTVCSLVIFLKLAVKVFHAF
jgi:hypothetical protein